MKKLRRLSSCWLAVIALAGWSGMGLAAPLDDLVAGAKKEGVIRVLRSFHVRARRGSGDRLGVQQKVRYEH